MKINELSDLNLFFGASSSIGLNFLRKFNSKDFIFYSRSKIDNKIINQKYLDLDKKIQCIPKKINKIFFLASPYYLEKNLKKNNYVKEKNWLKKICSEVSSNIFIYISSSSIYDKNHIIGQEKIKCENFLKKNSNSKYLQIWRPFNILSDCYSKNLSDHFHNILIKKFIIEKKKIYYFRGSEKDSRAYSSAMKFCKVIYKKSNLKRNFTYDYGNSNSITVKKMLDIFQKSFNKKVNYKFNLTNKNVNIISKKKNINLINTNENSTKLLENYFSNYKKLNEN